MNIYELLDELIKYPSIKLTSRFLDSNVIKFDRVKYLSSVKLPYIVHITIKGIMNFTLTISAYFKGIRMIRVDDDSVMS